MRAGALRHRITIQTPVYTTNNYNEREVSRWDDTYHCWAEIDPPKAREYFSADQVQSSVVHRIRIRYLSGLDTTMRIKFNSRIFHITSIIDPDERHRELIIMATEET